MTVSSLHSTRSRHHNKGDGRRSPSLMSKSRKKKKSPKRVLALPDLEQAKSAVLNTLTSVSGQRTYDHAINDFVECYCSEPRVAFNRSVVLRYRIYLEQKGYAPNTINLRLAAIRLVGHTAYRRQVQIERVRSEHYQSAPGCDTPCGLRGVRLGIVERGTGGGNTASQRSPASWCPPGQLAHPRPGQAPVGTVGHRHTTRKAEPCHSGDAHRLRPQARRASVFGDGFHPGPRGALGDRGPEGQGGTHPDGAGPAMGQGRG